VPKGGKVTRAVLVCSMDEHRRVTLEDGSVALVRALRREDGELLRRAFDRLSEQSRRTRFQGPSEELSDEDIEYLTDVDEYRHAAEVAIDAATGEAVGIARYVRLPGRRDVAEVAVEVVDDWHRRGVATALLVELTKRAREAGVRAYSAIVSPDSQVMHDVLRRLSAEPVGEVEHGTEYVLDLEGDAVTARLDRAS
jgi:RimJ/RimL family protein N-acetyltransferase